VSKGLGKIQRDCLVTIYLEAQEENYIASSGQPAKVMSLPALCRSISCGDYSVSEYHSLVRAVKRLEQSGLVITYLHYGFKEKKQCLWVELTLKGLSVV